MTTPPAQPHAASTRRSLTIASLIMMGSVLLSRLLGVARELVLAHFGGTSAQMDAYVAAFLIPELVNHLLAGGYVSITFIPIFQRLMHANDNKRAWEVFSNIFTIGTLLMGGYIGVSMVFTEPILKLVMGSTINSDPQQLALTVRMTRIILPAQLFIYWGALFMAVQLANKRFLMSAISPLLYNGGIIAGGLVLGGRFGMEGFSWGVLAGAFVGSVVLQLPSALKLGMRLRPRLQLREPLFINYILTTLPLIVGAGMQFSNEVLFRIFGSAVDQGGIASLNYALRTMWSLIGVFGQAFGIASFPFLASLAARGAIREMDEMTHRVISRVIGLIIPFSAVMMVLSHQIIAVLFQHGQFDTAATQRTATILSLYLIGAFTGAASTIVVRGFYALQQTLYPMILSTAVTLASVPLYWVLAQRMGAAGVALAGASFMVVQFVVLYTAWARKHSQPSQTRALGIYTLKTLVAAAASAAISFAIKGVVSDTLLHSIATMRLAQMAIGMCAGVPGLGVAFGLLGWWGVIDIRTLLRKKPAAAS